MARARGNAQRTLTYAWCALALDHRHRDVHLHPKETIETQDMLVTFPWIRFLQPYEPYVRTALHVSN